MTKDARKMSKLKLIMGITIPVFVMIASLIMVGVSFAWFSDSAQAEVATIDIVTRRVFTLEFSDSDIGGPSYNGQTALADGYLISPYGYAERNNYETANGDEPYKTYLTLGLATPGAKVDMTIDFKMVQIRYVERDEDGYLLPNSANNYDKDIYGANSTNDPSVHPIQPNATDKIPFVFTWFFVANSYDLYTANTVYTPYGIMTLEDEIVNGTAIRVATSLNGEEVDEDYSIKGLTPAGLHDFQSATGTTYDFYVVFAPQELFWMQFFPADRDRPYYYDEDLEPSGVYSLQNLRNHITRGGETISQNNKVYYSERTYAGLTFYFVAEINVTEVTWLEEAGE